MGLLARMRVVTAATVSIGAVAIVYAEVGSKLVARGTGNGESTGPFSEVINQVDTIVPVVLSLLLLAILVWLVVSSVQEERTVRRGPR